MAGIRFAWLAVWFLSPNWLSPKLGVSDFSRRLGEAAAPGGSECGPCHDFASYTLSFALELRKITENLSQGNRKALGWLAPKQIRLVDSAVAGDVLEWPAGPSDPWLSRQATG